MFPLKFEFQPTSLPSNATCLRCRSYTEPAVTMDRDVLSKYLMEFPIGLPNTGIVCIIVMYLFEYVQYLTQFQLVDVQQGNKNV